MTTDNRNLILSFGAAILIAVAAQIAIPIEPVPLTMQTAALFLIGLLLPVKYAAISVGLYLLFGAIGLPVYSDGKSGLDVLFGPTGGFLVGFLIITVMISYLSRNDQYQTTGKSFTQLLWTAARPLIVATILLQVIGILWGKAHTGSPWPDMYEYWLAPFYLNMVLKIVIAAIIVVPIWKRFSQD